jgi:hypothetical protein
MSADAKLDAFFQVLTPGSGHYKIIADMMALFCAVSADNTLPAVGLTDYGPNFEGADVEDLWTQLFTTFPDDIKLTEIPPRTRSTGGPTTIMVQTRLEGTHKHDWFSHAHRPGHKDHHSPPLSGLPVAHPNKKMDLPACAVFTFDGSDLITKLSIYFDRYRMAKQLGAALP